MTNPLDLSTEHLAALAAVAAVSASLCVAARRRPGRWTWLAGAVLGAVTAGAELAWIGWLVARGGWTPAAGLPLQLCDAGAFLAGAALWTRRRGLAELLWFWAMAGTLQGLLTPATGGPYPGFLWIQYYVAHGGIVASALFLVAGLGVTPRRGAALRAAGLTAAYAVVVGVVDAATGADYLYLRGTWSARRRWRSSCSRCSRPRSRYAGVGRRLAAWRRWAARRRGREIGLKGPLSVGRPRVPNLRLRGSPSSWITQAGPLTPRQASP